MTTTNDKAAPGSHPDTAHTEQHHQQCKSMPATAFSEAVEALRRDRVQELQIRELEASQELHKVCAAIGVQSGGILAVAAMASTLAKASAARMVAERLGVLSVPKGGNA